MLLPSGGLCNRLLAIHSTVMLSRKIGQPMATYWNVNYHMGAHFSDLFEVSPEIGLRSFHGKVRTGPFRSVLRAYDKVQSKPWRPLQFSASDIRSMIADGFDFTTWANRNLTLFKSGSLFFGAEEPLFPFVPLPHIQKRIEEIVGKTAAQDTIGVHIRRTDHGPSVEHSSTEAFLSRMHALLDAGEAKRFLLATDDPDEEAAICSELGDKIIVAPKRSYDRASGEAIEDAVVDLFALSSTKAILGSVLSTFSQTAGLIGNIRVNYIADDPNKTITW